MTKIHGFRPAGPLKQRLGRVLGLAVPGAATMLSYTLVGVVDTLLVGHLGPEALGAVGLSNTLFFTFLAFAIGLVHGATALIAQSVGAQRFGDAGRFFHHAQYVAVVLGGASALLLSLPAETIFGWMGPDPLVQVEGVRYLAVRAFGAPFLLMIMGRDGLMEGLGDTRTPLKVSILTNAINGVLDLWLIYGGLGLTGFGVVGAAWASNIAQCLAVLYYGVVLRRLNRVRPELGLSPWRRPTRAHTLALTRIGWPMGGQFLADVGGWMVLSVFLGWLGAEILAASQIAFRCIHPVLMASRGSTIAATTLVGQALGAGDPRSARAYGRTAISTAMVLGLGAALLGLVFAEEMIGLFTQDGAVVSAGAIILRMALLLMVAETTANAAYGMLQGAGDTRFALVLNLLVIWAFGVPMGYALAFPVGLGAKGIFLAMGLQMSIIAGAYALRLRGDVWLKSYVPEGEAEGDGKAETGALELAPS